MWSFLLRLALPVLVVVTLLAAGWLWLRAYTQHDTTVRVPEVQGLSLDEAHGMLANRGLVAVVIDSVHTDQAPKGSVVTQNPAAGDHVKPGRKVYLVLNATQPKMMDMPKLVDLSKRQALSVLEILGLRVGELIYKPDPCVDCVIEQLYKGVPIAPEERIRRGETITLVLGSGDKGERVPVPDLRGLSMADARLVLNTASLNVGLVVECTGCNTAADTALARVSRQAPSTGALTNIGSPIDLWLSTDTLSLLPRTTNPDDNP
jgi:beta-lactam-binding protein with PASTA domain